MIIKPLKHICNISDSDEINVSNWIESLDYNDNVYKINEILKKYCVSMTPVHYLPSFKGRKTFDEVGLPSTQSENEMKIIKVRSELFIEDRVLIDKIRKATVLLCKSMVVLEDTIIFTLN